MEEESSSSSSDDDEEEVENEPEQTGEVIDPKPMSE